MLTTRPVCVCVCGGGAATLPCGRRESVTKDTFSFSICLSHLPWILSISPIVLYFLFLSPLDMSLPLYIRLFSPLLSLCLPHRCTIPQYIIMECRRSCVSLRKSRDCASRCVSMRELAELTRTPSQNCFKVSYSSCSLVKYCAHGTSDILMVMYAVFLFPIIRFLPRIGPLSGPRSTTPPDGPVRWFETPIVAHVFGRFHRKPCI